MLAMKLVWLFLLLVLVFCDESVDLSIWNHVLKMEHVIASVEHYGRQLHVWKEEKEGYNRFYVTPLCELINSSIHCIQNKYADDERYIYRFSVRLWDKQVGLKVKNVLQQQRIDAISDNILPLPMTMVRLNMDKWITKRIHAHNGWRSNQNQPSTLNFELFIKDKWLCQRLVKDSIKDPGEFLANFKLELEFTIISGQTESRNLNITGSMLRKSNSFAYLSNEVNAYGNIYLTSTDCNKLAKDIYQQVAVDDVMTSGYIPSEQENHIIQELLDVISEQQVESTRLSELERDSVFWDDIFTRPDIQTEYLNEVFTYNKSCNCFNFHSNKERDFYDKISYQYANKISKSSGDGGTFGIGSFPLSTTKSNDRTEATKHFVNDAFTYYLTTISKDELAKSLEQNHINSRWNGQKFEQKPITLHRVNIQKLSSRGQLLYKRVVLRKLATTSKIEILPEPPLDKYTQESSTLMHSEDLFNKRLTNLERLFRNLEEKLGEGITSNNQKIKKLRITIEDLKNDLQSQIQKVSESLENTRKDLQKQINNKFNHLQNQIDEVSRLRKETYNEFINVVYIQIKPKIEWLDYHVKLNECKRLWEGGEAMTKWIDKWREMGCGKHCAYFTSYRTEKCE